MTCASNAHPPQALDTHNALLNEADKIRYQLVEDVAGCVSVGTALRTLWKDMPRAEETRQLQVGEWGSLFVWVLVELPWGVRDRQARQAMNVSYVMHEVELDECGAVCCVLSQEQRYLSSV